MESTDPKDVDSIILFCSEISLDSIIKSLSANWSETLYGYVFLIKFESSILNKDWFNL